MKILKQFFPIVIIILLSYWAIAPLLNQDFFPMHDDEQIGRLFDLNAAIQGGHIPPRISPNLGFGYGYPFFNFYPSFAYYVGEIFVLLGLPYIVSTKLMLITGFLFAAFFMYLFAKELFNKTAGIVAAIAYTYSSYHAVDVYVRGAFAEFFSFVFIPLIFWSILKLKDSININYVIYGAFGVAGLILSHNLIALMSGLFLFLWLLFIFILTKKKKKFLLFSSLMFVLGFGLTAYFWLPSYAEKEYTLVNILTSELANYNLHFVCVHQLWNSAWGYGGSIASCFDGLSFEIGKLQIVLSLIAFILAVYYLLKGKEKILSLKILVFSGFLLISAFLTVKYSKPLWDTISLLWYIQFPWRFLLFASFFASILCGGLIMFVKKSRMKYILSGIIIVLVISLNAAHFIPQRFITVTDNDYINREKIRWETSSLAYEYVPKGIVIKKSEIGTTLVDINKEEIAKSPAQVISGAMVIKKPVDLPHAKSFEVEVEQSGIFQINTFSFPGWEVAVDGEKVIFSDENKFKLIQLPLSQGNHIVEARFSDTPIRMTGNITSFLSIIVVIVLVGVSLTKKKNEKIT